MTPSEIMSLIEEKGIEFVDFKFADLLGAWQHYSVPARQLSEKTFTEGLGFDGSSIRGWRAIHQSDMLMIPDPATAWLDSFFEAPTLGIICSVHDPVTGEPYTRDPRSVAEKAQLHLKESGVADVAYFGPEPEFFVFDAVRCAYEPCPGFHQVDPE